MKFTGVLPALTTPFDETLQVDHGFLARHAKWMLANGCTGLVMLGSLGEGAKNSTCPLPFPSPTPPYIHEASPGCNSTGSPEPLH